MSLLQALTFLYMVIKGFTQFEVVNEKQVLLMQNKKAVTIGNKTT